MILLTNWRIQGPRGAAPMYAKRTIPELPEDFLRYFVISAIPPFTSYGQWIYVLKQEVDITAGYNIFKRTGTDQTAFAGELSETMFHEQTHAAHYNKVGNGWWNDFVDAELNNIIWHMNENPPYGLGNQGAVSDIIALGESWGYHMGHFMVDLKYAASSPWVNKQGFQYRTGGEIWQANIFQADTDLNSNVNLLEDFDNHRTNDPDSWIPIGLYYDLLDNRNDNNAVPRRVPLNDDVLNYNNDRLFNALDSDIRSLPAFRVRLLNENGNDQAAGVNAIFQFYNVF